MISDLMMVVWLTGITGLIVLVAARWLFALGDDDATLRGVAAIGCLTLVTVVAVSALADGNLLNWFTLTLVCIAAPAARWLGAHGWSVDRAFRETARRSALAVTSLVESGSPAARFDGVIQTLRGGSVRRVRRAMTSFTEPPGRVVVIVAILSAAAAVTIYLRYAPVLGDVRLGSPEAYAVLLQTRQALFNHASGILTPVTAAIAAALSLATSLNPLHVVRLLGPAIGVAVVCAGALLAYRLSSSVPTAAAVMWILGACTFGAGAEPPSALGPAWILDRTLARQWTANDGTTGLLFLLLAGIAIEGWRRGSPAATRGAAACLSIVAMSAPMLLVLLAPVPAAVLVPARVRLFTLSALWTAIGVAAAHLGTSDLAFTMPVAVALLAAAASALVAHWLGRVARANLQLHTATALVLATLALLPQRAGALHLEHEIAAAKTLEIASTFPRGRWMIVAPIEQLAEIYGRGWFEDPASFVQKYARTAGDREFTFDIAVDDLFVFVERRPFKTFESEAADVPFSTLTDPSYRYYRSLAGRASLQAQLQAVCKAYIGTHADASVYHEDARLTIYRFPIHR